MSKLPKNKIRITFIWWSSDQDSSHIGLLEMFLDWSEIYSVSSRFSIFDFFTQVAPFLELFATFFGLL